MIDNTQEELWSTDIEKYIEELREEIEDGSTDEDELETLLDLKRQYIENNPGIGEEDWELGVVAFIRDDYFEEHAQNTAVGTEAIFGVNSWPANHIDWRMAAQELKEDYDMYTLDGVIYWAERSF